MVKIGKATKVAEMGKKQLPSKYFEFTKVETVVLQIMKVRQIFKKNIFSPNIFLLFSTQVWTIFEYRRLKTPWTKNCILNHMHNFTFKFFCTTNFCGKKRFERWNPWISKRCENHRIHRICWISAILVVKKWRKELSTNFIFGFKTEYHRCLKGI